MASPVLPTPPLLSMWLLIASTTSPWLHESASSTGVRSWLLTAVGEAPCDSSSVTTGLCPLRHAQCCRGRRRERATSAQLRWIETLRTLRLIRYAAWLARRWDDPAFPHSFPWFNTDRYWADHILELREQLAAMDEEPLRLL